MSRNAQLRGFHRGDLTRTKSNEALGPCLFPVNLEFAQWLPQRLEQGTRPEGKRQDAAAFLPGRPTTCWCAHHGIGLHSPRGDSASTRGVSRPEDKSSGNEIATESDEGLATSTFTNVPFVLWTTSQEVSCPRFYIVGFIICGGFCRLAVGYRLFWFVLA